MIGPKRKPQEFGFNPGDTHLVVNDYSETAKAYDFSGKLLWEVPCLARGRFDELEWTIAKSDTPPGLYKLGELYKQDPKYDPIHICRSYGPLCFDMIDLEGNEDNNDRAGICIHGGGSPCGWPGAFDDKQGLYPTWGCVRMYNGDLRDRVLPLYNRKNATVFVSVWQES